jgi:hypothetical protein
MIKYFILILVIALIAIFLYLQNNIIDTTKYYIKSDNITNRIKIVQLSDLHSKASKAVLKHTAKLSPDIIVITGDFINDHGKNKDKMLEYGKELLKIAPVYYITGNHERRLDSFDSLMQELKEIGFKRQCYSNTRS